MNRRDFIHSAAGVSLTSLCTITADADVSAAPAAAATPAGPAIGVGVIGLGDRGREVLHEAALLPTLTVAAICDIYDPFVKRAQTIAPQAKPYADYKALLADPAVTAIVLATPSNLHREIALAALQAGKHLYCEAPLASNLEDAKAIATAGLHAAPKLVFQAGLQKRVHPQYAHVDKFVKTGALGTPAFCRSQWHYKTSWRKASPNADEQQLLNWRLSKATSPGLAGEVGIHSMDVMNWYLNALPTAVTGFGSVTFWKDGRDVPDTVQAVLEYPGGVHMAYDATLVNSFDDTYDILHGSQSAMFLRGDKGWMVNEADAPLEGWIVYARKEKINDDTGIVLVADATKLLALGKMPGKEAPPPEKTMLHFALKSFAESISTGKPSASGPLEGYQATVTALVTNSAVNSASRIEFTQDMFALV